MESHEHTMQPAWDSLDAPMVCRDCGFESGDDAADAMLSEATYTHYARAWHAGNHNGEGFPVGALGSDVNALAGELAGELIRESHRTDELAVYRNTSGWIIAVGDVHGPWAVRVA